MIRRFIIHLLGIQPAVAGIIVKNGKVLLTKRARIITDGGKWCLPGGGMNKWETAINAVKREIFEEVGLKPKKVKFLFVHEEFVKRIGLHAIVFVFTFKIKHSDKIKTNWEVSDYKWFSRKEIIKLDLAFTHKDIFRKYFGGEL